MVPAVSTVNLSSLGAPTPTPTPTQACAVNVVDETIGVPNSSSSGTVAVPAAAKHTLQLTLVSPFASNSVSLNGVVPSAWSALPPGLFASVIPDVAGQWTLAVTTPGAAPNSVTIEAY